LSPHDEEEAVLEALISQFAQIEDPRCPWRVEHKLIGILVIAVCAVLGEAESFEDIALHGRGKRDWLQGFLELPGGIPSHDTFRRVLMLIDPDRFERCFLGRVRAVFRRDAAAPRQIALDGKTARRSFDRRRGRSPLHLVSAYATAHGLVLAQRATEEKKGELAVLPDLLDSLDLKGCLVSPDALACRPEVAGQIVNRGGDYLITLKGNQKKARAEVKGRFARRAFALGAPAAPSLLARPRAPASMPLMRAPAGWCAGECSPARM
jgi:DDE_Tnp_1-associated/Transposase DDE domain